MKAESIRSALLAAFFLAAGVGASPAAEEAPASGDAAQRVPMVEFRLDGETVRGKLVAETPDALRVRRPARGVSRYPKEKTAELRRFGLPAVEYHEWEGDEYRRRMWEGVQGADAFVRARAAYREASRVAEKASDRERLSQKLSELKEERQAWQQEQLRRLELQRARHEAERAELRKQAAREELQSVQRLADLARESLRKVRQMEQQVAALLDRQRSITARLDGIERDVRELEDDLDRRDFPRPIDIGRRIRRLERRVDRLERADR